MDKPPPKHRDDHPPSIFYHQQKKLEMVTISGVEQRKNAKDDMFPVLILTGDIEIITSKTTGKPYATVRKVSIPCTFDAEIANSMIGRQIPGAIIRKESEPYQYASKQTGEVYTLHHTYAYNPNPSNLEELVFQAQPAF
ncbi:MAG: hypothetical protein JSS76_16625 [Bacteroidetes bacterium]|nr:hypothetical protein [Bacteroidota bacterium]